MLTAAMTGFAAVEVAEPEHETPPLLAAPAAVCPPAGSAAMAVAVEVELPNVACGVTDIRKGFDGLPALVQTALALDPHSGGLYVFRGKRGDLLQALLRGGQALVLYAKRPERGRLLWPQTDSVTVTLTSAQIDAARWDRRDEARGVALIS